MQITPVDCDFSFCACELLSTGLPVLRSIARFETLFDLQDIFRMNQKQLEIAVRGIQNNTGLDSERKAYLMQNIMASRYIVAQQNEVNKLEGGSAAGQTLPTRTYHDASTNALGCAHYKRK